jgi:hypothetical protein
MSEDVPPYGAAAMLQYVFACPHCRVVDKLERDGEFSVDLQCSRCRGWARIRVSGPNRELTVGKRAAPEVRR